MSLLLDALNKADQERKRNEATPGINSNHEQLVDQGERNHSILLIAAIIIGLAILLAGIYWLGQRSTTSATPTPAKNSVTTNASKVVEPKVTSQASDAAPAEPIQEAAPSEISTPDESVAGLYQQNAEGPTESEEIPPPVASEQAPNNQEVAPVTEPNPATPNSIHQFANLPELHDLPNNILEKIPTLNYSEHNYNANGGSVKINGNIHHTNEQISEGLVIDKILEDGMILHIDNYSFKMRAMNSWVNM